MAESEEELKSLLMKVKVESERVGLKLNIQKMKIWPRVARESWGWLSSHCRAEETSPKRVSALLGSHCDLKDVVTVLGLP